MDLSLFKAGITNLLFILFYFYHAIDLLKKQQQNKTCQLSWRISHIINVSDSSILIIFCKWEISSRDWQSIRIRFNHFGKNISQMIRMSYFYHLKNHKILNHLPPGDADLPVVTASSFYSSFYVMVPASHLCQNQLQNIFS